MTEPQKVGSRPGWEFYSAEPALVTDGYWTSHPVWSRVSYRATLMSDGRWIVSFGDEPEREATDDEAANLNGVFPQWVHDALTESTP